MFSSRAAAACHLISFRCPSAIPKAARPAAIRRCERPKGPNHLVGLDLSGGTCAAQEATIIASRFAHGLGQMKSTEKVPTTKFPRHQPQTARVKAEQALFEEMEHAAELLQSEDDFGRAGVCHAIHACHSFLHVRGLSGQALKPLIDLVAAFENIDKGVLPELFDPSIKRSELSERKWSRSYAASEIKIHAAACMEALMKTGKRKNEAATYVARRTDYWPRVSHGLINANTVTNWRDELLQQSSDNRERKRFEQRSAMFGNGARAKEYLAEALRHGPVQTGGVHKGREAET